MRKKLSLVLAIILTLSSLAGCSQPKEETPSSSSETQSSAPTVTKDSPSWKIDTSPVELEWFVGYDWASATFNPEKNTFDKYVLDETGTTIKWSYGNKEKLNMLISTNTLPDILTYDMVSSERLLMEDGGLLLPLNELAEKYAPDFKYVKAMRDWYANDDGNWYGFASYFYDLKDVEERGGYLLSHNMNYARKDIMDQLKITAEDLKTQDGFVAALKKVKDAKIEYNGKIVEPYMGAEEIYLSEQFGVDREDKDGNLINIMREPEYLEAILFLNRLYREGLITDEVFTMDSQLARQKVSSGHVFAGTTHTVLNGKDTLYYSDNNALMTGFGFIKGSGTKEPIITPTPTGGWTGTFIPKTCKHPDRAIRLFSFYTSEESMLASSFGGLGGYDIVDGKAIMKPGRIAEREKDSQAFNAKYNTDAQSYFRDMVVGQVYETTEGLDAFKMDELNYRTKYQAGRFYDDKIFTKVRPEGGSELAALEAQVKEYWKQLKPSIVMAKTAEEAEKIYKETIVQLDKLGMQKIDDYKNERFKENKKKMGLEFAWPRNK